MLVNCLAVGAGGALGTILRYLLFSLFPLRSNAFPLITLGINIIGAFFIGLIVATAGKNTNFDPRLLLFLRVGICGGFTTFSAFSVESMEMLQNSKTIAAITYMMLSVILCISSVGFAQALVK